MLSKRNEREHAEIAAHEELGYRGSGEIVNVCPTCGHIVKGEYE